MITVAERCSFKRKRWIFDPMESISISASDSHEDLRKCYGFDLTVKAPGSLIRWMI